MVPMNGYQIKMRQGDVAYTVTRAECDRLTMLPDSQMGYKYKRDHQRSKENDIS